MNYHILLTKMGAKGKPPPLAMASDIIYWYGNFSHASGFTPTAVLAPCMTITILSHPTQHQHPLTNKD